MTFGWPVCRPTVVAGQNTIMSHHSINMKQAESIQSVHWCIACNLYEGTHTVWWMEQGFRQVCFLLFGTGIESGSSRRHARRSDQCFPLWADTLLFPCQQTLQRSMALTGLLAVALLGPVGTAAVYKKQIHQLDCQYCLKRNKCKTVRIRKTN